MNDETIKLLQRLKNTSDGKDFISFLIDLSQSNYDSWKHEGGDVLRGKAIALDNLILLFQNCNTENIDTKDPNWAF
jgi:hypothetical protein